MRYGVCADWRDADKIARAGYDYIELALSAVAGMSEAEFDACARGLEKAGLPCEAVNVFFPNALKLTGPEAVEEKIAAYCAGALERAARLGAKTAVLGSGASRWIPRAFPRTWPGASLSGRRASRGTRRANTASPWRWSRWVPAESNFLNTVAEGHLVRSARARIKTPGAGGLFHVYNSAQSHGRHGELRRAFAACAHRKSRGPALSHVRGRV
jgi:hypothetical protein